MYLTLEPSGLSLWVHPRARRRSGQVPHVSLSFGGTGLRPGLGGTGTQLSRPQNVPAQQGSDFPRRTEPAAGSKGQEGDRGVGCPAAPWLSFLQAPALTCK